MRLLFLKIYIFKYSENSGQEFTNNNDFEQNSSRYLLTDS